ncbi:MAG: zf-HC2 domain-containing protein [Deltaproteobacteria bacterium]|nr:zf-HC2 domain-containing protein [Deltaproteobacteria bacterium]
MDCKKVLQVLQDDIDGKLPPSEATELRGHLESCRTCAGEAEGYRRVGDLLRMWTAARVDEKRPQLESMWIRVQAGIEELRYRQGAAVWLRRWLWVTAAAALAVLILLFYPSDVSRSPFHPSSFEVSVEDLESDTATVALVDKGDDLPRVIWIIEDDKT